MPVSGHSCMLETPKNVVTGTEKNSCSHRQQTLGLEFFNLQYSQSCCWHNGQLSSKMPQPMLFPFCYHSSFSGAHFTVSAENQAIRGTCSRFAGRWCWSMGQICSTACQQTMLRQQYGSSKHYCIAGISSYIVISLLRLQKVTDHHNFQVVKSRYRELRDLPKVIQ